MKKKKDLSEEDKKTWEDYLKSPSDIFDKEEKNTNEILRKERFNFDLHGFTLDEANQKAKEIILSCVKKKIKEILLITGKGLHSSTNNDVYVSKNLSKLKFSVPEFINNNNELKKFINSISDASQNDGGTGAILIKLKNL